MSLERPHEDHEIDNPEVVDGGHNTVIWLRNSRNEDRTRMSDRICVSRRGNTGSKSNLPQEAKKHLRWAQWVSACLLGFAMMMIWNPSEARGDEPMFGFSYTTDLLPKGKFELEQWSTTRFTKAPKGKFWLQENRTEVEYGLSDKLQLAFYANYDTTSAFHNGPFGATTPPEQFSYYSPGPDAHFRKSRFLGVSGEAIYRITSPYKHRIGFAIYAEPTIGAGFYEMETRLIFQKNFKDDRLILAGNLTYAPEWRRLPTDADPSKKSIQEETDINMDAGISYRFARNWSAGFEFLNEREFNSYNFTHESNSGFFVGPTVHYGGKHFFVTGTFVEQMPWAGPHVDTVPGGISGGRIIDNDFEKYRVRIKVGWYF